MGKKIELTREQIDKMIALYKLGKTHKQIGKELGFSEIKVGRVLKEECIKARSNSYYIKTLTDGQEKEVIEKYYSGMNMNQIAKEYGCSEKVIDGVLRRNNVKKRTASEAYRTYAINDYYFDSIDNQDKAYMLGFFYADAYNTSYYDKGHYDIGMTLQLQDKYILDEMCHKMGMNRDAYIIINSTNKKPYARMDIMNKHMVIQLEKLGIVPKKSRKTKFPFWLDEKMYSHFIRGLLDGDGSIPKSLDRVHFCGSRQLMCDLSDIINQLFGFKPTVGDFKQSKGISYIQVCDTIKRLRLLDWIYSDANMKLVRKYELYLEMKEKYECKLAG